MYKLAFGSNNLELGKNHSSSLQYAFLALSCTVKKLLTQACMDYRAMGDSMTPIIAMLPKKQPSITSMLD